MWSKLPMTLFTSLSTISLSDKELISIYPKKQNNLDWCCIIYTYWFIKNRILFEMLCINYLFRYPSDRLSTADVCPKCLYWWIPLTLIFFALTAFYSNFGVSIYTFKASQIEELTQLIGIYESVCYLATLFFIFGWSKSSPCIKQ